MAATAFSLTDESVKAIADTLGTVINNGVGEIAERLQKNAVTTFSLSGESLKAIGDTLDIVLNKGLDEIAERLQKNAVLLFFLMSATWVTAYVILVCLYVLYAALVYACVPKKTSAARQPPQMPQHMPPQTSNLRNGYEPLVFYPTYDPA